jgi:hypothetical protein
MNEKKYPPGMSPEEFAKTFSEAMDKEHEAMEKLPKIFKKGEMLEEVPGDDDALG